MREQEDLSEDVLPIAATRPAMRFGLPLPLLIPLGVLGAGIALVALLVAMRRSLEERCDG